MRHCVYLPCGVVLNQPGQLTRSSFSRVSGSKSGSDAERLDFRMMELSQESRESEAFDGALRPVLRQGDVEVAPKP